MKKFLVLLMVVILAVVALASCGTTETPNNGKNNDETVDETKENENKFDPAAKSEGVMTYAEYDAAALDAKVVIEAYVQGKQAWWENKATVYAQDPDGAYFLYEMACTEADYAKLENGTKIKVTGNKTAWEGEVEIVDATFEIVESEKWIAEATDVTALLGTDDLIKHQNKVVTFKGMTIEKVEFKNNQAGNDIYVTVAKDGKSYDFCVESYLTDAETEVYKAVSALKVGDVIDIDGFLYWYQGVNTHITAVAKATNPASVKSEGVMTYAEYDAAALDAKVVIEAYVQGKQAWWENKATVYAQDPDGAYFLYEMACTEADYAKLENGTKIKVTGNKTAWEGEVEIVDATFEIVESEKWIAEATDVTALLGTDDLIKHQNKVVTFKGMTIEKVEFKNNQAGNDIYVTVAKDGKSYDFCVESYLTDAETEVYKAVSALKVGDVIDIDGFLYWYQGVNTHITAVKAAA